MSIVPIFKRRVFTRKVIYRLFQLNVWTFQKCKNAHTCALRDCLGVSRPFVSDKSLKCIDREGLERCRTGTRQHIRLHAYSWNMENFFFFSLIFSEKAFFIIKSGLLFWFGFVQLANPRKTYLLVYSRGYLICTNDQFPKSRCQLRLLKQKVSIVFVCNCKKKSSHLHAFSR